MILEQSGTLAPVNEPWTLIRDAIFDLELQEKQEGVDVDMDHWHFPYGGGACHQCLAGSVMSRRLGVDTDAHKSPDNYPKDVAVRLHALDDFRIGDIYAAYDRLDLDRPASLPLDVTVPSYHRPPAFKAAMLAIADLLEAAQPTKTKL